ncbi:MAG TPA: DUF4199 domain-containing protein [Cyclobacteriaceae bacterium]
MINEPQVKAPTTMSVGLKYGLLMTVASVLMFVLRAAISGKPFDRSVTWTIVTIAVSVAIIVLAHREYKNNGDGFMTYGQGFVIGFWISLVSVVAYGVFIILYANVIDTELMDNFYQMQREQMETAGNMSNDQVETAIGFTKKLFFPMLFVMGLIFSLITVLIITIFTQKSNPNPAM